MIILWGLIDVIYLTDNMGFETALVAFYMIGLSWLQPKRVLLLIAMISAQNPVHICYNSAQTFCSLRNDIFTYYFIYPNRSPGFLFSADISDKTRKPTLRYQMTFKAFYAHNLMSYIGDSFIVILKLSLGSR